MWNSYAIINCRDMRRNHFMSSISKKYKKNNLKYNLRMSIRLVCPNCNNTKIISQERIQKIKKEEFENNEIFKCNKCNIIMNPTEVIADF